MKSELYFRHDVYALDDTNIIKLVIKFKDAGYGIFWAIVERLTAEEQHKLSFEDLVMYVCMRLRSEQEFVENVIGYCCELGVLKNKDGFVYNERVIRQCLQIEEQSEKCRQYANARWEKYKGNAKAQPQYSSSNANNNNNNNKNNNNINEVLRLYSEICVSFPKVMKLTDIRKTHCKALLEKFSLQNVQECFHKAEASDFLKHGSGSWNGASFDWLINTSNFVKVLEGNYDNKKTSYVVSAGQLSKDANGGFAL